MTVPEGAQRSEDGNYWWDDTQWQLIPEGERQQAGAASSAAADTGASAAAGAAPAAGASAAPAAGGEPTREDFAHIQTEDQIDDRAHPYFAPNADTYPDDLSQATVADHLSDAPAEGSS